MQISDANSSTLIEPHNVHGICVASKDNRVGRFGGLNERTIAGIDAASV